MAEGEHCNFLHYYQNILLKDSSDDPFDTCSTRRKCLALAFQASLEWSNNELSAAVLDESLKSYASLVDARGAGDVDNYSAASLALAFNCQCECLQWESSLKEPISIPELLQSKLECQCNKITNDDVKKLLDAKKINAASDVKRERSDAKHIPRISFELGEPGFDEGSKSTATVNSSNSLMPTATDGPLKWQKSFTPKQGSCGFSRPSVSDFQTSRNLGTDSIQQNPVHSWQKLQNTNEIRISRTEVKQPTSCVNTSKNAPGTFRTAREELGIQNQKKWGHGVQNSGSSNSRRFPCRSQKHLGTSRRPPVHDDFVIPLRQESDQENRPPYSRGQADFPETEDDERLKGIDPKMVDMIKNEIIDSGTPVDWDDIAGLDFAKATIQEIVVWPLLRPDIFFGLRGPPKGILLFGPPGTGKTLIGKCIASQSKSTFFSISASSLTSKWIGEGEKMVRALFAVARCHPPAVIFIDEIDSLLSQRNETDHESSRRIKTEFLVQLDGAATLEEERILVIGATNRPQELDEAARRRLVKRLYIPLPESKARRQIIVKLMSNQRNNLSTEDIDEVAGLTDGYSGADMKNLCREAALGPIRSIRFEDMEHIQPDQVRPVVLSDFKAALSQVRASVSSNDLDQYITWNKQYGCVEAK